MKRFIGAFLAFLYIQDGVLAGNEGHGGDPFAAEFVARGSRIYAVLLKTKPAILTIEQLMQFNAALKSTQIELVSEDLKDPAGGLVTSVVEPDPAHPGQMKIRINKEAWKRALSEKINVNRFVLHEYLRASHIEDGHYELSTKLDALEAELGQGTRSDVETIILTENIRGSLVAATKAYPARANALYHSSPEQGEGYYYTVCRSTLFSPDEAAAKEQAIQSHTNAYLTWILEHTKAIESGWNTRYPLVSVDLIDDRQTSSSYTEVISDAETSIPWDSESAAGSSLTYYAHRNYENDVDQVYAYYPSRNYYDRTSKTIGQFKTFSNHSGEPCHVEFGFQKIARKKVSIRFQHDKKIHKLSDQAIKGSSATFDSFPNDGSAVIAVINSAIESYKMACVKWKEAMRSKLGEHLVFADCGTGNEVRKMIPSARCTTCGRDIHFESRGSVYFSE